MQGRNLVSYALPTIPTVYFVNGTTLRTKELLTLEGNANGISLSPDGNTLYVVDTGASETRPVSRKNPYGPREMWAFDLAQSPTGVKLPLLTNRRMLSNPIQYIYDGVRVSRNGWIFAGGGEGLSVIDPESGLTLGVIRLGGGHNEAVTVAFGEHELWIVGKGGIWHVDGIVEQLT